MTWKIIGGISVVIMCFLSVLSYKGKYWPLRKEYLDHPNRREWQKRNAILLSLMAISGFFTQFILKDLENNKFYDFGYIIMSPDYSSN